MKCRSSEMSRVEFRVCSSRRRTQSMLAKICVRDFFLTFAVSQIVRVLGTRTHFAHAYLCTSTTTTTWKTTTHTRFDKHQTQSLALAGTQTKRLRCARRAASIKIKWVATAAVMVLVLESVMAVHTAGRGMRIAQLG